MKNKTFHLPIKLSALKLSDDSKTAVSDNEVARIGNWSNSYNQFIFTKEIFKEFIKNFDNKVMRREISFFVTHKQGGVERIATGEIKKLFTKGDKLMAKVEWTEIGIDYIRKKLYKYPSIEFVPEYKDQETSEIFKNVLTGATLTNEPFIRDLEPLALSDKSDEAQILYFNNPKKMKKFLEFLGKFDPEKVMLSDVAAISNAATIFLSDEEQSDAQKKIDEIEESAKENEESAEKEADEAKKAEDDKEKKLSENKDALQKKTIELSEKLGDKDKAVIALSEQVKTLEDKNRKRELTLSVDSLIEEGRILPKSKEGTLELLLSENPESAKKMLGFMQKQPKVIDLSENKGTDEGDEHKEEGIKLSDKQLMENAAKRAKEEGISLSEAFDKEFNKTYNV